MYAEPVSADETALFLSAFLSLGIPVYVLGGGSNVLFSDKGFRGAVVSTVRLDDVAFERVERAAPGRGGGVFLRCGGGCPTDKAVDVSVAEGFGGLERFAGLPGSVGGAAYMNARCYDRSVSDVFARADVLRVSVPAGRSEASGANKADEAAEARGARVVKETKTFDAAEWGYKKSPFQPCGAGGLAVADGVCVLTSVVFKLTPADKAFLRAETERCRRDREEKGHFRLPSAGSVFKNNRGFGKPSGVIVDEAGLKGMRLGGAQVAPWHGNIIVNTGGAAASDIRRLVESVSAIVREKHGFALEPEILFAGDWDDWGDHHVCGAAPGVSR